MPKVSVIVPIYGVGLLNIASFVKTLYWTGSEERKRRGITIIWREGAG